MNRAREDCAAHLLMTTDAVGGVFVYAETLAARLCAMGWRITLVVEGPPPSAGQMRALDGIVGLSVVVTDLPLEWMDHGGAETARSRLLLARLARRHRPDIVHVNGYRDALVEWGAPTLVMAHSCCRSWSRACRGADLDATWRNYVEDVSAALDRSQAWASPTKAFRDEMAALYEPARHGLVIPNGTTPVEPTAGKAPFVLAAGRIWDEAKNIAALLRIASRCAWPIHLAGPIAAEATEVRSDLFTDGTVIWLGALPRPALAAHMRRAAIFVSPARYEPFGLTVLEAAHAGCALVLSDLATFRELWNGAALFVDPEDDEALANALQRLTRTPALRSRLAAAARRRARTYTDARMARTTADLYGRLLAPQAGRATAPAAPREAANA